MWHHGIVPHALTLIVHSVLIDPQVGFRHTAVANKRLMHNGRPLMVRGVNRHEFDDVHGKAVSEQHMLRDVLLMKRAGFNAVRCSHYPNADEWWVGVF